MTKPKGRAVRANAQDESLDAHLTKLEALHTKVGGLLHVADRQGEALQDAAIQQHDSINAQIAKLDLQHEMTPEKAQQYGRLLVQRKHLQETLLKQRQRQWDRERPTPI